jgi:HPr kinase/phosphorylase
MQMAFVRDLYETFGKKFSLELVAGTEGLNRNISKPEVFRPGLCLAGSNKKESSLKLFLLGDLEISFFRALSVDEQIQRFEKMLSSFPCAIIMEKKFRFPEKIMQLCNDKKVPLFFSTYPSKELFVQLVFLVEERFAFETMVHGTLVEVFGMGLLLQGEASIGKSEVALGLLDKGHLFISDDLVKIRKKQGEALVGFCIEPFHFSMQIRGIGLIDVARLFGAHAVKKSTRIEGIIHLEEWKKDVVYEQVGLHERYESFLGVNLPFYPLPYRSNRDLVLLIEILARNFRLKEIGHHSAREFQEKLLKEMHRKSRKGRCRENCEATGNQK